ncbi:MAG: tetratricopeptide repeat protein [Planctomycetota bacterium]
MRRTGSTLTAISRLLLIAGSVAAGSSAAALQAEAGQAATPAAFTGEMPERAARFHGALLRRPEPGYVFDRFCGSWVAESSTESLEAFLADRAATGESADGLLLAYFYVREGRKVDAIRQFRATIDRDATNARAWFEKARAEAATLDFATALTDLERAAEHAADEDLSEDVAKLRGRLLVRTGEAEQATEVWEALAATRPDDETLREDLVQLAIDEGMYERALESLTSLIETTADPQERVTRRMWLAQVHLRANERDEAIGVLASAIGDVGASSWFEREILAQLDAVYRRAEDLLGWRDKLAELEAAHPERIDITKRRATLLGETGDIDEAIAAWESVIARTPGDRSNRMALARLLAAEGRTDAAIERLEALLEAGGEPSLHVQLAELRSNAGDDEGVVQEMQAFLEASDGSVSSMMRAVGVLERLGQATEALQLVRDAAKQAPDDIAMREALAEVEHRLGDADAAVAIWKELAGNADGADGVIAASRALMARSEPEAAQQVLADRARDFGDDPLYVQVSVEAAVRAGLDDEALDAALRWVSLARDDQTGERSVQVAARLAERQEAGDKIVAELEAKQRTPGETCLLAVLLQRQGELARADAVLEAAADDPRIIRQRAALLIDRGEFAGAVTALERMLDQPGASQVATVRDLIDLSVRTGQFDTALRWVTRWRELVPGSPMPGLREAEVLTARGEVEAAIDVLEDVRRRHDDDVMIATRLAGLYTAEGRYTDAERVYWDLFEEADSTEARQRWVAKLAEVAQWMGSEDRLLEVLESRREGNRRSSEPSLLLAEAYRELGDDQARRDALLEAARLEPRNLDLLLQIASVEQASGEIDRALATLRRAEELDTTGRVPSRIAELLIADGRLEEAVSLTASSATPIDADGVLRIADRMAGLGEWSTVVSFLDTHSADHNDYRLGYLRAIALEEEGRFDDARRAFLDLLDIESERPGVSAGAGTNPFGGRWASGMPPEAAELFSIGQSQYQAYLHQQRYNAYYYSYYSRAGTQTVTQPSSVDELRTYSIVHLATLANLDDDAGRDLVIASMVERGVRLAEVIVEMNERGGLEALQSPELLERYPDDPALLAIATMYGTWGMQSASSDVFAKAADLFEESYPNLAMLAKISAFSLDQSDESWEKLRAAIEAIDEPSDAVFNALSGMVGGGDFRMSQRSAIEEQEQADWLIDKLLAWLAESDDGTAADEYAVMALSGGLAERDDYGRLASLIEQEIVKHRAAPASASAQSTMAQAMRGGWGRYYERTLQPLDMPPAELQSLPGSVTMMLGENPWGTSVDVVELAEAVDDDADPVLRAVLASASADNDAFLQAIEPVTAGDAPQLDGFLLLAAHLGQNGEPEQAVAALSEAVYLPMTRPMRERVDEAIIAYAMQTADEGAVREAGQRSALRLLYATRDADVRKAVVASLDGLGLADEAEREREKLAASGTSVSTPGWATSAPAAPGDLSRIVDALDDDRVDAGLRIAQRVLESAADQVLSGQTYALQMSDHEAVLELIERRGLIEQLVENMNPGQDASAARTAKYAAVLELLDRPEDAEAAYALSFETRPDGNVGSSLMRLMLERDAIAEAVDVLVRVPEREVVDPSRLTSSDESWMYDVDPEIPEPKFHLAQLALGYLREVEEPADSVQRLLRQALAELRSGVTVDD